MENKIKTSDTVTEAALRLSLAREGIPEGSLGVLACECTGSTNADAMKYGEGGGGEAVFLAKRQTAGRGRLGRSFLSPEGGLYMSLLLRPTVPLSNFASVTAKCAVAVSRAVESLTGLECKIKWVNDVYVNGRKLAGILTQGRTREDGKVDFAVIGIGINLAACDLGEELRPIATSVEKEGGRLPDKCSLAARVVKEILSVLDGAAHVEVLEEYRRRSLLDGREVKIVTPSEEYSAKALGIDGEYRLLLERDGEIFALSTGEASARLTED